MRKQLLSAELKECRGGGHARLNTRVGVFEDAANLYFVFDGEQDFPYHKHWEYNAPLYEGDIYEVLLTLSGKNRYLEIEVNGNNAAYCVIIDNKDGEGDIVITKLDRCVFEAVSRLDPSRWTAEIKLPKDELRKLGRHAGPCMFNMHRQDFDADGVLNLYSLYPTFSGSFHKTASFGRLNCGF